MIYANPRRASPWRGRGAANGIQLLVDWCLGSIAASYLAFSATAARYCVSPEFRLVAAFIAGGRQREKRNAMRGQANRSRFDRQTLDYGRDPSASAFNTLPFNRTVVLLRSGAVTVKRAPGEGTAMAVRLDSHSVQGPTNARAMLAMGRLRI